MANILIPSSAEDGVFAIHQGALVGSSMHKIFLVLNSFPFISVQNRLIGSDVACAVHQLRIKLYNKIESQLLIVVLFIVLL